MRHDAVLAAEADLPRLRRDYRIGEDAVIVRDVTGCGGIEGALEGRTGLAALVGAEFAAALPEPELVHLLASLRDRHCRFIRVVMTADRSHPAPLTRSDLLALGFTGPHEGPNSANEFVYDADEFNAPREWNNAADWAHPERFDKDRW